MRYYRWLIMLATASLLASCGRTPPERAAAARVPAGPVAPVPEISADLADAVALLRTMDTVAGAAVGPDFEPGWFFRLTKYFIAKGSADDFRALCREKHPVARAMGVLCLALSGMTDVPPEIVRLLDSRARVDVLPWGCCVEVWREADLVRMLLRDPSFLGHATEVPQLPERARRRMDLGILADDRANSTARVRWGLTIDELTDETDPAAALEDLKSLRPDLATYLLVKAVGRGWSTDRSLGFLVHCVRNGELGAKARLAAASGLAADAGRESRIALGENRPQLDALAPGSWGTRLLEELDTRARRIAALEALEGASNREERARVKLAVLALPSIDHPAHGKLLSRWLDDAFVWRATADLDGAAARVLRSMATRLDEVSPRWHVSSDLPYWIFDALCQPDVHENLDDLVWRELAATVASRLPADLRELLDDDAEVRHLRLGIVCPAEHGEAPKTIDELLDELFGTTVSEQIRNLRHENVEWRRRAVARLTTMGPPARAAIDALKEALHDSDHEVSFGAARALAPFREDAAILVPAARRVVASVPEVWNEEDTPFPKSYVDLLATVGRAAAPARPDVVRLLGLKGIDTWHRDISRTLRRMGPASEEAAMSVVQLLGSFETNVLRDPQYYMTPNIALRSAIIITFSESVPVLAKLLAHREPAMRRGAARVLSVMGATGRPAVDALARALDDDDRETRLAAVRALADIGFAPRSALPSLKTLLMGDDDKLAVHAAHALGELSMSTDLATLHLIDAVSDGLLERRESAALGLMSLGEAARDAAPALAAVLRGPQREGRDWELFTWSVARALCRMSPSPGQALLAAPHLVGEDGDLLPGAIEPAGSMGPAGRGLLKAARFPSDRFLRERVRRQLVAAEATAAARWRAAMEEKDEPGLSPMAKWYFHDSQEHDPADEPGLLRLLGHSTPRVRLVAAEALSLLEGAPSAAVLEVLDYADQPELGDDDGYETVFLPMRIRMTEWRDEYAREFLWLLLGTYHDVDEKLGLLRLMMRSGCPPRLAMPILELLLDDREAGLREAAVVYLGEVGAAARDALPSLHKATRDEDALVRLVAVEALRKVDGGK